MLQEGPAIGIDLGTTYSCVGVLRQNGNIEIIPNDQGNRTTPSIVAFNETGRLIGEAATHQSEINAANTVFGTKRLIGRNYGNLNVQSDEMKYWPFYVANIDGRPKIRVMYKDEEKLFYPEEISAMILVKMKEIAEKYLNEPVTSAVISVPAYFNNSQRQSTKDAGAIAGLKVLRIMNESTAAALACGLEKPVEGKRNLLIYGLGGGTFDVSIVSLHKKTFVVKSTAGNTHLGGDDFDYQLVTHFADEFRRKHKKDLSGNKHALQRLRIACERAKRTLSSENLANIELDALHEGIDFYSSITRAQFEILNFDLIHSTLKSVQNALNDAKLNKSAIAEVILLGGSTRIPLVQRLLKEFFDGRNLQKTIPDEAVAYGAAVQAFILQHERSEMVKDILLVDVTPVSLGVALNSGGMRVLIERNTTIPAVKSLGYSTKSDNQSVVTFPIFEGEHAVAKQNNVLGEIQLSGIPPAPARTPQILVTFEIDHNGILNVTAIDQYTVKMIYISILNKSRNSASEIVRMIKDAKMMCIEDQKQVERMFARNVLENYCHRIKILLDHSLKILKIEGDVRETVLKKVDDTIQLIGTNQSLTIDDYSTRQKELESLCNFIFHLAR